MIFIPFIVAIVSECLAVAITLVSSARRLSPTIDIDIEDVDEYFDKESHG
jgi:hypothetical protein